jgi:hypothetical protein
VVHVLKYDVAMSIWTCYICPVRQYTWGSCDRISTFKFRHYSKIICSIFEKYVYDGTSLILYLSTAAFETSESGKMVSGEIGKQQQHPVSLSTWYPERIAILALRTVHNMADVQHKKRQR